MYWHLEILTEALPFQEILHTDYRTWLFFAKKCIFLVILNIPVCKIPTIKVLNLKLFTNNYTLLINMMTKYLDITTNIKGDFSN